MFWDTYNFHGLILCLEISLCLKNCTKYFSSLNRRWATCQMHGITHVLVYIHIQCLNPFTKNNCCLNFAFTKYFESSMNSQWVLHQMHGITYVVRSMHTEFLDPFMDKRVCLNIVFAKYWYELRMSNLQMHTSPIQ